MLNQALFTSDKNYWETPQDFFDELDVVYHFNWDLAASDLNHKTANYFTEQDDSLAQNWGGLEGNLFLNPPYGRAIKDWVKKASETKLQPNQYLVMLIPSRTDTAYFHDYIFGKAEIKFLRGRLKFELNGQSKDAAPFPSALVIYKG